MDGNSRPLAQLLEEIYAQWHRPEFIVPDPLQLVRTYRRKADREVAGLICSSLALGRVESILKASRRVLEATGPPSRLADMTESQLRRRLRGFVFRFFDAGELVSFLFSIGHVLRCRGSLEAAFADGPGFDEADRNRKAQRGLIGLVSALRSSEHPPGSIIVADPTKSSASKRMHLFLRWMVRNDAVDPGGWDIIRPSELLVPVDVHMHRIARQLDLTGRASADHRASLEITASLRMVDRVDPVRFDFALTRLGIHPDGTLPLVEDSGQRRKSIKKTKDRLSKK